MIIHTIRAKDGGSKKVSLTPLKAIKYQCHECMGFVISEVKKCTNPRCTLFPFRLGTAPGHKGKGNISSLTKK